MKTNDFLFFLQLILPICDVEYLGVPDDHDGCIVRNGVSGGGSRAVYQRCQIGTGYHDNISMALTLCQWLQI